MPPKPKKPTTKGGSASAAAASGSKGSTAASSGGAARSRTTGGGTGGSGSGSAKGDDIPPSAGFLISCDVPMKQYIQYLNDRELVDKRFIIQDLDATHLLIKHKAKEEIMKKVEEWEELNIFSAVERVGEDLNTA